MNSVHTKGLLREKNLSRDTYFSDLYFSMPQLCSFSHQLHHIWSMKPKNVLEIGIGNGFISEFLKRAGISVTTADINQNLNPDICAPLNELSRNLNGRKFDLIICCEVLEHMPLSELDNSLSYLRELGDRLFMTLPNANRTFGIGGLSFIPKLGSRIINFNFNLPYKHNLTDSPHFWEVGYTNKCTTSAIVKKLKKRYESIKYGNFSMNPNHIFFECI